MTAPVAGRVAIRCIRPDQTQDRARDEREMMELGVRLRCAVDDTVVVIVPTEQGPWATVANALARTAATHVIVPDIWVVDGIDGLIRARAELVSVAGQQVMDEAEARARAKWAAIA